jgi:ribosomal protein RSM22 (predicted rRNA methylase)
MSRDIPAPLGAAIAAQLHAQSRKRIAALAGAMSDGYRAGRASREVIGSEEFALAYLLARLPATYAAVSAVLGEIVERAPAFAPASLLDAGAGPGTASWAAMSVWPGLVRVTMLDDSEVFRAMAHRLAAASPHAALAAASVQAGNLTLKQALPASDLVIASYALAELSDAHIAGIASRLWEACAGILLLVEPGTPAGYRRLLACRDVLLTKGASVVAPCAGDYACPLREPDWCHFSVRLARSRDHMIAKGAQAPFEDEKYCYLALARPHVAVTPAAARVLAPPRRNKVGIGMKLCTGGFVEMRAIASRERQAFAKLRRVQWGDGLS